MDDVFAAIANQPTDAVTPSPTGTETGSSVQAPENAPSAPAQSQDLASQTPALGNVPTSEPTTPAAPQAPQISEAEFRAARQEAQQFRQLQAELQQLAREQQARQQQEAEQTRLAQAREQIRAQAMNMAPEDAITYIDRQYDQLLADQARQQQMNEQKLQQQFFATLTEATRPAYAHHLAQTHGLPAEYEQRLQMLPPQQMDQYIGVLVQEYQVAKTQQENYQKLMQELDQIRRSQTANGLAASGAHNVGGVNGQSIVIDTDKVEKGSPEHLLSIAGGLFGFSPQQNQ